MSNPYTKDEINAYRAEPVVVAGTGMFNMRRWLDTVAFLDERGARLTGERDRLSARVAKLEAEQSEARNRVARLEAALRFYAEPSGYLLGLRFRPVVVDDGGMRARAALEDKS